MTGKDVKVFTKKYGDEPILATQGRVIVTNDYGIMLKEKTTVYLDGTERNAMYFIPWGSIDYVKYMEQE